MAFELISGPGNEFEIEGTVTAGTAIQVGEVLAVNGNVLERATASSTIHTIFGVSAEAISTAATKIRVTPIIPNAQQVWRCDTAADTATTQRYECAILSTHAVLDNSESDVTGPTGIFMQTGFSGATTDRKAIGYFNKLDVTST